VPSSLVNDVLSAYALFSGISSALPLDGFGAPLDFPSCLRGRTWFPISQAIESLAGELLDRETVEGEPLNAILAHLSENG